MPYRLFDMLMSLGVGMTVLTISRVVKKFDRWTNL
jgi:hypothetical protein